MLIDAIAVTAEFAGMPAAERRTDMSRASLRFTTGVMVCGFLCAGVAAASRPSLNECFEASDFISNAALSRDGGMPADDFLGRMEADFMAIRAFPNELRWFAHDPDDELFLLTEAREVFRHPEPADNHRRSFLQACIERMAEPDDAEPRSPEPAT
jgi:hypothetical protein